MLESPVEVKSDGPGPFPIPGRSPTRRSHPVTRFMSVRPTWLLAVPVSQVFLCKMHCWPWAQASLVLSPRAAWLHRSALVLEPSLEQGRRWLTAPEAITSALPQPGQVHHLLVGEVYP